MCFIGIDLGTSFIKGAVLDLEARQLKHIQRLPFPNQLSNRNPLFCEFDPNEIIVIFRKLLGDLLSAAPGCAGLVMCTQMHGMVLMDPRGRVVSPCLTWRDQRTTMPHPSGAGTYFDVMARRITARQHHQVGNELRPGTPGSFLFWMAEQGELTPDLMPVSILDFVLSVLAGSPASVESTNAMAYGLFNIETMDWHHEVIQELGLGELRWPAIRKHGEVVAHLKLGASSLPCYSAVGDYQCALLGALLEADELSLNISTGSQVSLLTAKLNLGDFQTRPFFDGMFTNTFTHILAGRALNVLVDLLTELATHQQIEIPDPWSYIARESLRVDDTDLCLDLNFFANPFGDRGGISNMRQENLTVGHLFRAAFNNMAQQYYDCALRISPERSWRRLVFSGGLASKLETLRQVIQKRFQTEYRMAPFAEDTLTGLLILARAFSGRSASITRAMRELRDGTM